MSFAKRVIVVAALLLINGLLAWSQSPVVVVLAGANATTGNLTPIEPSLNTGFDIDWRTPAGRTGFVAAWASARLSLAPLSGFELSDRELLGVEIGALPGIFDLRAAGSIVGGFGVADSEAWLEPSWNFSGMATVGERGLSLGPELHGSFHWSESGGALRIENRVLLRAVLEPGLTTEIGGDATFGIDVFPTTYVLALDGSPTGDLRQDMVILGTVSVDRLTRYFSRWQAELASGVRVSNANRYIAGTSELESRSEDRLFAALEGSARFSPAQSLGINVNLTADAATYMERAAIDESGQPLPESLSYLRSTAGATATWSPNGRLFLVLGVSAAGAVANDALYEGWSATAGVSVEIRL